MRTSPLLLALASTLVACGVHTQQATVPVQNEAQAPATLTEPASEQERSEVAAEETASAPADTTPEQPQQQAQLLSAEAAKPAAPPPPPEAAGQDVDSDDAPRGDATALLFDEVEEDAFDMGASVGGVASVRSPSRAKDERKSKGAQGRSSSSTAKAASRTPAVPPPVSQPEPEPAPDTVSNTEGYTHYGVNPMTLSTRDRLSTFSIDVDTASYSIARRKLQSGQLPPTSSVRVEEFVNAQDYGYTAPTGDAPFAVYLEAAPNPFQDGRHVLRVGVKGAEIDSDDRAPVHLTFLVDVSGSMSSHDKLGLAKRSLHELVENLQPQDTVALATYAGHVARVLDPMPVTSSNSRTIHRAIDRLESGGGTGMSSGVDLAYELASSSFVKGEENRVIVLSDGDANIGPSSHTEILRQIKGYSERGITLSTIGFGMGNYKDVMMEQLANNGDGNYFYIDSMAEAQEVFGEDLSGTLQVIAKDVKIQVEFNPEAVYSYRLIGYENRDIADRDFRNDRVDAGEIGAGHTVTALYDVVLADGGEAELATVRLRNKQPGADSPAVEWSTPFPSELLHSGYATAGSDLRLAYGAATFAELLRGSPYGAEVTYSQLYELVADASRRGHAEDAELLALIATAGQLSGERGPVAWR